MGQGKLVDDLSPSKFDSLVKVLSLPRDFRFLLMPTNLREVFDKPEDFIVPKVLHLNYESSGDTRAMKRVLSHLLSCIQAASEAQTQQEAKEIVFGDDFSLPPSPHRDTQARLKRLRDLKVKGMSELRQRATPERPSQAEGRSFIPR